NAECPMIEVLGQRSSVFGIQHSAFSIPNRLQSRMPCSRVCLAAVVTLAAVLAAAPDSPLSPRYRGWRTYGGSPDQIRYSSLRQIDRTNVEFDRDCRRTCAS